MAVAVRQNVSEMAQKRQEIVFSLASQPLSEIRAQLKVQGVVNPSTGKEYSRQTIRQDLLKTKPTDVQYVNGIKVYRRPVAETIGTWTYVKPLWNARILLNVDTVWKDYIFLDALRRGMAPGYRVGGLFCMPIAQTITSHMLGGGISGELMDSALPNAPKKVLLNEDGKPTKNLKAAKPNGKANNGKAPSNGKPASPARGTPVAPVVDPNAGDPVAYTNAQLRLFFERNQGFLQTVQTDKFCFGNQYVIVNPDCSLAIVSPETVTVEYSASDYRRPLKYIIRTKMEKARVEDIYEAHQRTIITHYYDERGTKTEKYENLTGRIPIVHFTCDRSANEIYGRPAYEAALPLMEQYDDLVYKMVEGTGLLSMPVPVFEGLKDVEATKKLNSTPVIYYDEQGNQQTEYVTRYDRNAGLWIGEGGKATMLNPPVGFTKDILDVLRQLFLLLLNHTRIPEFVWGGAIASSKASAEVQLPPFIQYIKYRRLEAEGEGADPALALEARGGLLELVDIWLKTYKLLNPSIVTGPVRILWPQIDIQSDQIRYMWGTFLRSLGDLNQVQTLKLAGYWDDPDTVAAQARGEERRQPEFDDYDKRLRKARLAAAKASLEPLDDDGQPYSTDYYTDYDNEGKEVDPSNDINNPFGPLQWQHMFSGGY